MRHLILSILSLLALSACSPWQYMTVNSAQLIRNPQNQLIFENDTLRLTYDMAGKDGEVTLRILNKTNEPLYVNWHKSAFIRDQQSVSLYNDYIIVHGRSVCRTASDARRRNVVGSFTLPDGVDFIPPGTITERTVPNLASTGSLQLSPPDSLPEKKLVESNGINTVKYRQVHYDEATAPIRFKSYITFSIGKDNKEFSETQYFYIGEVYFADCGPENFALYHGHGDQIYIRQRESN